MGPVFKALGLTLLACVLFAAISSLTTKDAHEVIVTEFAKALLSNAVHDSIETLPHVAKPLLVYWHPHAFGEQRKQYQAQFGNVRAVNDIRIEEVSETGGKARKTVLATLSCEHVILDSTFHLRRNPATGGRWLIARYTLTPRAAQAEHVITARDEQRKLLEQDAMRGAVEQVAQGNPQTISKFVSGDMIERESLPTKIDLVDGKQGAFKNLMRTSFGPGENDSLQAKYLVTYEHLTREYTITLSWVEVRYMITSWIEKDVPKKDDD